MITYEQIEKANEKLSTITLGSGSKAKDYVMVPQRVKAFRMLYPGGFILTDILSHENNVVLMQARAGYYDEKGEPVVLGTGLAFEEKGKGMVNGTSYIENCETSAVGRALGFLALGIDGGGICSAEELANAITAQGQMAAPGKPFTPPQAAAQANVSTGSAIPANVTPMQQQAPQPAPQLAKQKELNPVGVFINEEIAKMRKANPEFNFVNARKTLIAGGVIQDIKSSDMTMDDAKKLIDALKANFGGGAA